MKVKWGGGGETIVSLSKLGQRTTQMRETKKCKEEEEEEALLATPCT